MSQLSVFAEIQQSFRFLDFSFHFAKQVQFIQMKTLSSLQINKYAVNITIDQKLFSNDWFMAAAVTTKGIIFKVAGQVTNSKLDCAMLERRRKKNPEKCK